MAITTMATTTVILYIGSTTKQSTVTSPLTVMKRVMKIRVCIVLLVVVS